MKIDKVKKSVGTQQVEGLRDRILQRMDALEMSQARLARACKRSEATIGKVLRGTGNPRADTLQAMARALQAPVQWLMDGNGPAPDSGPYDETGSPAQTDTGREKLLAAWDSCLPLYQRLAIELVEALAAQAREQGLLVSGTTENLRTAVTVRYLDSRPIKHIVG